MTEPREVAAMGRPQRYHAQEPELLAKISERSCPAGWALELVKIAAEPWGLCRACGLAYRIRGGVLEYAPVKPGRRALVLGREAGPEETAGPARWSWRATPDGEDVPLIPAGGSFTVTASETEFGPPDGSGYTRGAVPSDGWARMVRPASDWFRWERPG